jgi:hypothetical protein
VFWRVLLLGPLLGMIGLFALVLVLASLIGALFYAGLCLFTGEVALGVVIAVAWVFARRHLWHRLERLFEGIEYASL